MRIQAPDIPRPKLKDADYMKVWHKLLDKDLECYRISRECSVWRRNFYIVSILFVILFAVTLATIT